MRNQIKTIADCVPASCRGTPAGDLIAKATASTRHNSRVDAVVSEAYNLLRENFIWGLLLEGNGVGGHHGAGVGGRTDRGPILKQLGSGRRHARDGAAYDAAIEEVLTRFLGDCLVPHGEGIKFNLLKIEEGLQRYLGEGFTTPLHEWVNDSLEIPKFSDKEIADLLSGDPEWIGDDPRDMTAFVILDHGYGEFLDAFMTRLVLESNKIDLRGDDDPLKKIDWLMGSTVDPRVCYNVAKMYNNWTEIWGQYLKSQTQE